MRDKLKNYVDSLFVDAELTIANAELKNEILNDTLAHYDDLLANGQSEQNAYTQTIQKIGDVSHLIAKKQMTDNARANDGNPYQEFENKNSQSFTNTSTNDNTFKSNSQANAGKSNEQQKTPLAPSIMLAVAIGLYICSVIPCIIFDGSNLGVILMFLAVGVATALIILRGAFTYKNVSSTKPEVHFREGERYETRRHRTGSLKPPFKLIKGIIDAVLFIVSTIIYVGLSITFGAWHIAWLVFIISVGISEIIEGIFQLVGGAYDED